jgi:hypothetical protein
MSFNRFPREEDDHTLTERLETLHGQYSSVCQSRPKRISTAFERALTDFIDASTIDPTNYDKFELAAMHGPTVIDEIIKSSRKELSNLITLASEDTVPGISTLRRLEKTCSRFRTADYIFE